MTVKELRDIIATLPDEMEVIIGGEQRYWELGGMDWADGEEVLYLVTGNVANGVHVLPSLAKDTIKPRLGDASGAEDG